MSSSLSLSQLKSPRNHAVAEAEKKKKKKKKMKLASSSSQINPIWNEEDDLALLKGLADYRAKTGSLPNVDCDEFHRFLGDSIAEKLSKDQIQSKIRDLKERFFTRVEKINPGEDPIFSDDEEGFKYSNLIWGQNDSDSEFANVQIKNVVEDNVVPLNENNAAMETEIDGDGDVDAAEELCIVRDAFETLVSSRLGDYQKKDQLEKLMKIGRRKRKELSDEWKALCYEEMKLKIKKFRFFAKLAEEVAKNM